MLFYGLPHPSAKLPKRVALCLGLGKKHFKCSGLLGNKGKLLCLAHHGLFVGSVHFHKQVGLDTWSGWNRHAVYVLEGPIDGVALHEFQSAGGDSGLKNATDRGACYLSRRKGCEQRQMMARVGN